MQHNHNTTTNFVAPSKTRKRFHCRMCLYTAKTDREKHKTCPQCGSAA